MWESIRDVPTVGVLRRDEAKGIVEIGWPVGVVVGLCPSTNPNSTAVYKVLISVKARNGVHHRAAPVGQGAAPTRRCG